LKKQLKVVNKYHFAKRSTAVVLLNNIVNH